MTNLDTLNNNLKEEKEFDILDLDDFVFGSVVDSNEQYE